MAKKILNCALSVGFFVTLFVGVIMVADLIFNGSSSFFDRMSDASNIFKGLGK